MKRRHDMPFGAEYARDGTVNFRLWAPSAQRVELCLESGLEKEYLDMEPAGGGWHALQTEAARIGRLYRFRIDGGLLVPDPASRFQPEDALGPSQVVDPEGFEWTDGDWKGRPWEHCIFYELHIGAYTPRGLVRSLMEQLDYLCSLGVTALQIMPINSFPGRRNWGYDGVLMYSPEDTYGHPEDYKTFIQECHRRGLMVFLDVVYNHFGPLGNYLKVYAPQFFTAKHTTPWGDAINFDSAGREVVRSFFINNALYWLKEYNVDGLRFDASDWLIDDSEPEFLVELAQTVRREFPEGVHKHLVLENDWNRAGYLRRDDPRVPKHFDAQWNEDLHHVLHSIASGEVVGYYVDYKDKPAWYLGRSLTKLFAYQGEHSFYRDKMRGEKSDGLHATATVAFLQNHDQVGNRPFGDRITALSSEEKVKAVTAIFMLSPSPPMIFMGQEYAIDNPFPFFCDLSPELAPKVSEGRKKFFAGLPHFAHDFDFEKMPDPSDEETFQRAKMDLSQLQEKRTHHHHREWLEFHQELIRVRKEIVIPRLAGVTVDDADFRLLHERTLLAWWRLNDGSTLTLLANLDDGERPAPDVPAVAPFFSTGPDVPGALARGVMPGWSVAWFWESDLA